MKVEAQRRFYTMSGRKLRRARRLWVRINFEKFWNGGGKVILAGAQKAIQSGLWAKSGSNVSVCFSIVRYMYKLYRDANPGQYDKDWSWHRFWDHHPWLFEIEVEFLGKIEIRDRWGYGRINWSRIAYKNAELEG